MSPGAVLMLPWIVPAIAVTASDRSPLAGFALVAVTAIAIAANRAIGVRS